MSIEKIMKLAEAQANARVEAAKANLNAINAQMEQLQITRQAAISALTAANAAKAKLEGMIDEYYEAQEQPSNAPPQLKGVDCKIESPDEEPSKLEVFAAHNKMVGTTSAWLVVAASSKEEAVGLINSKSYGNLVTTPIDLATGSLNKKVAAKALDNPRVVHIINSNSRKSREL